MKKTLIALFAFAASAFAQTFTLSQTSLTAAMTATQNYAVVASATGLAANRAIYIDNELMPISALYNGTSLTVPVTRLSLKKSAHITGAIVMGGRENWFQTYDPFGSCTASGVFASPWININTGARFKCLGGQWGKEGMFRVPPTSCTFAPTTLTTTNTYVQIGASNALVLNGVSNAAAGTQTLVCDFVPPTEVTTGRGAVLYEIVSTLGSQVVAPTSLGTSTLGTVTFPTPVATTQTASVVTPVAAGSTVTTVGPTTTVLTVTTAGAFLTFSHSYAAPVDLNTDLQSLHFTFPILQSAASAMTLNTTGLFVHYILR